jgi:uncharacterized protein
MRIEGKRWLLVAAVAAAVAVTSLGFASAAPPEGAPGHRPSHAGPPTAGSLLVHITHGPDEPTRASLGFLIARTAVDEGHDVTVFLAGDGAWLITDDVIGSLVGVGTGVLSTNFAAVQQAGVPIYISGGSAQARGITAADLEGKNASFAAPSDLVRLTFEHDRVLVY